MGEVKLYGVWASSYCNRVQMALKLKGIPYEYVEEDVSNKSRSLLNYNPVHKKVPVLVHNGRPIAESLVILEYVDEFWKKAPLLLPEDPYERAKVRFWANFYDQKLSPSINSIVKTGGEEQEKAIKELLENMRVMEEELFEKESTVTARSPFFNGDSPGFLDIVMGSSMCNHRAVKEALVVGTDLINLDKYPFCYSWLTALEEHPIMKDTLPPHDKLVELIRKWREKLAH
ncbi:PREDICTED: glutathione S-transferase U9 [Nelumbo nucifera]|uniref:Glutathione S-transferase n=2 Tax=Nelumbo nucifera TaxID=4432 RepID=A0A822YK09_NELNU|nr:PREDICTED: glutathione S-transferase U9 [Nelumbo nucifera]DAD31246.1 TPA_asm: hypothetical protein HUJ06_010097 [Nelumbo nucifera]